MKKRKSFKLAVAATTVVLGIAFMQTNAYADDTNNTPRDTSIGNFLGIKLSAVTTSSAGAEVDTDITLNNSYVPCKNTLDSDFGGCQFAPNPGYYKSLCTKSFSPANYFTVDNVNRGVTHYWAQRVQRVDVEIYPKTASTCGLTDSNSGRVRFTVLKTQGYTYDSSKGGSFTPNIGAVTLPPLANPVS